ncbi:MAG: InlB B-repeat-containing protein [Coriobacteriia bacterium]|nr:InlB B-repeat-containing protein [Coriobacteriia bacterium]
MDNTNNKKYLAIILLVFALVMAFLFVGVSNASDVINEENQNTADIEDSKAQDVKKDEQQQTVDIEDSKAIDTNNKAKENKDNSKTSHNNEEAMGEISYEGQFGIKFYSGPDLVSDIKTAWEGWSFLNVTFYKDCNLSNNTIEVNQGKLLNIYLGTHTLYSEDDGDSKQLINNKGTLNIYGTDENNHGLIRESSDESTINIEESGLVNVSNIDFGGPCIEGEYPSEGGHFYFEKVTKNSSFKNCQFTGGTAGQGGNIYINKSNEAGQLFTLENCTFRNSCAKKSDGDGGAIKNKGEKVSFNLDNCKFLSCSSDGEGGAIASWKDNQIYTLKNTVFSKCHANDHGGAFAFDGSNSSIKGDFDPTYIGKIENGQFTNSSLFEDCYTEDGDYYGGAIYTSSASGCGNYITIDHVDFKNNHTTDGNGGALCLRGSKNKVTNCLFQGNKALKSGTGGAIYVGTYGDESIIEYCLFYNNTCGLEDEDNKANEVYIDDSDTFQTIKDNRVYTTQPGPDPGMFNNKIPQTEDELKGHFDFLIVWPKYDVRIGNATSEYDTIKVNPGDYVDEKYLVPPQKTGYEFQYWEQREWNSPDVPTNVVFNKLYRTFTPYYVIPLFSANTYEIIIHRDDILIHRIYEIYEKGFYWDRAGESEVDKIPPPTKDNYTFDGYYTIKKDGQFDKQIINQDGSFNVDATVFLDKAELYPKWIPNVYKITLDDASGSGGSGQIYEKYGDGFYSDQTCPDSAKIDKVNIPERENYDFKGYYTSDGKVLVDQIIDEKGVIKAHASKFTSDGTKILAKWEPKVYEITLDNTGAKSYNYIYEKYGDGFYSEQKCSPSTRIEKVDIPVREGYDFKGYYTSDGKVLVDQIIDEKGEIQVNALKFTSHTLILAKWEPKIYTISLNKDSGEGGIDSFYEKYNEGFYSDSECHDKLSFPITIPTRSGFDFCGYYSNNTKLIDEEGNKTDQISETYFTSDTVLKAKWTDVYTITLDNQKADDPGTELFYEKYDVGFFQDEECTTKFDKIVLPVKTGYDFEGYFENKGSEDKLIIGTDGKLVSGIDAKYFTSHTTLVAKWTPKVFKITLDDSPGEGGSEQFYEKFEDGFYSDEKCEDEIINPLKIPTREGYDFCGYYTSDGNAQIVNEEGELNSGIPYTYFTEDTVLKASWEHVYKITLDNQGADPSHQGTPVFYEKYDLGFFHNIECTTKFDKIVLPVKTGYDFEGYFENKGSEDKLIIGTDGKLVSGIDAKYFTSHTTLVAKWTVKVFKITLDDDPGEGGSGQFYEKFEDGFYSDEKCEHAIVDPLNLPTREGYDFCGYYTSDGNTQIIDEEGYLNKGIPYTYFTEDTELKASWEHVYKITLDNKGADQDHQGSSVLYEKYDIGFFHNIECTTKFDKIVLPVKTGYEFKGYFENKDSEDKLIIGADGKLVIGIDAKYFTSHTTLVAKWTPKVFKITLDDSPGEGGSEQFYEKFEDGFYSDEKCEDEIINPLKIPTREGYDFCGYYTSDGNAQIVNEEGELNSGIPYTYFTEDTVLKASWEHVYKITLDNQGADPTHQGTSVFYEKYDIGFFHNIECTTLFEKINLPVKTGYEFEGYFNTNNKLIVGTDGKLVSGIDAKYFTSHTTLVAKWTPKVFKITLDDSPGEGGSKQFYEKYGIGFYYDAECNNPIKDTDALNIPTNPGYKFCGYYTVEEGELTAQIINEKGTLNYGLSYYTCTEDITLKAFWQEGVYTLELNSNGADYQGQLAFYEKRTVGFFHNIECTTQFDHITLPKKTGYDFEGYFTKEGDDFDKQILNSDGTLAEEISSTEFDSDTMLYAKWKLHYYNIKVNSLGQGKTFVDKDSAVMGDKITLTIIPESNNQLDKIETISPKDLQIDKNYSFIMPAGDVEINVYFKQITSPDVDPHDDPSHGGNNDTNNYINNGNNDNNANNDNSDNNDNSSTNLANDNSQNDAPNGGFDLLGIIICIIILSVGVLALSGRYLLKHRK